MEKSESEFLSAVASVLEVSSIAMADEFRSVPDWCSLKAFGLLVLLENDFATPLTISDLANLRTVADLWLKVGGRK